MASQQSWPKSSVLPYLRHDAAVCIPDINPGCGQAVAATCWDIGWMQAQHGGQQGIQCHWPVAKNWNAVSMQMMVTFNSSWNVAHLKLKLLHNMPTGCFKNHLIFQGNNITFIRLIRCAFHTVVWWNYSSMVNKFVATYAKFLQVLNPNGRWISLVFFAVLTTVTDRQTDRQTTLLSL